MRRKEKSGRRGRIGRHLPTFNTLVCVENLERGVETMKTLLATHD